MRISGEKLPMWLIHQIHQESGLATSTSKYGESNLKSKVTLEEQISKANPLLQPLLKEYSEVFGALPPPGSCPKLVMLDLELEEK